MPKVTKINRAGKDYPQFGIKKGETHYVWAIKMQRGGIVRRSKTYPRQSQLTLSDYKIQAHQINEQIEDFDASDVSDIEGFREEIVSEAQSLLDEQQDKLDSMPEGLQQGSTGELIQERIDALEGFISELEGIDVDEFEPDEETDEDLEGDEVVNSDGETEDEWVAKIVGAIKGVVLDVA